MPVQPRVTVPGKRRTALSPKTRQTPKVKSIPEFVPVGRRPKKKDWRPKMSESMTCLKIASTEKISKMSFLA